MSTAEDNQIAAAMPNMLLPMVILLGLASSVTSTERIPVIIIADVGVDDAGALLTACGQPSLDILGVVANFGGHSNPNVTARNARALLKDIDRMDIPVFVGAPWPVGLDMPLQVDGSRFHGWDGLGGLLGLDAFSSSDSSGPSDELAYDPRTDGISGAEFIVSTARGMPGQVYIICFSPLTNMAVALSLEPKLPSLIKGLLAMGGAVHGVGNASPIGEANFVHDANAARAVVGAFGMPGSSPLVLAPLEITMTALLTQEDLEAFGAAAKGRAKLFVDSWATYQGAYCTHSQMCDVCPLHDAHPVIYLIDPSIYTPVTMRLRVLVSSPGDPVHGFSLVDRRPGAKKRMADNPPAAGECDAIILMKVDEAAFKAHVQKAAANLVA